MDNASGITSASNWKSRILVGEIGVADAAAWATSAAARPTKPQGLQQILASAARANRVIEELRGFGTREWSANGGGMLEEVYDELRSMQRIAANLCDAALLAARTSARRRILLGTRVYLCTIDSTPRLMADMATALQVDLQETPGAAGAAAARTHRRPPPGSAEIEIGTVIVDEARYAPLLLFCSIRRPGVLEAGRREPGFYALNPKPKP